MKALRWHGQRDIRVEEVPEPSPVNGEVKVKVKWCAICTSDIHEFTSGPILIPTKRPHPLTGRQAPITLGHEFSGDVVEIGSGVTGTNVGDRVTLRPTLPCYDCYWCRQGRHILCNRLATLGEGADGGFAEYVVARSDTVYILPEKVTYEMAALSEPSAAAVHACKRARLSPGDSVAVVGAGPIGLLVIQAARAAGASRVFAIEPLPQRGEIAKRLGATKVINPREVDAAKEIANLTERRRADVVFECVGTPESMLQALPVSGRGGKIIVVGQATEVCPFPFGIVMALEKEILGSCGYEDEFPTVLSYMSDGRLDTLSLITAKIKLDDIIEKGFKVLDSEQRVEYLKILVSPE